MRPPLVAASSSPVVVPNTPTPVAASIVTPLLNQAAPPITPSLSEAQSVGSGEHSLSNKDGSKSQFTNGRLLARNGE
jgi:hypothetical protein